MDSRNLATHPLFSSGSMSWSAGGATPSSSPANHSAAKQTTANNNVQANASAHTHNDGHKSQLSSTDAQPFASSQEEAGRATQKEMSADKLKAKIIANKMKAIQEKTQQSSTKTALSGIVTQEQISAAVKQVLNNPLPSDKKQPIRQATTGTDAATSSTQPAGMHPSLINATPRVSQNSSDSEQAKQAEKDTYRQIEVLAKNFGTDKPGQQVEQHSDAENHAQEEGEQAETHSDRHRSGDAQSASPKRVQQARELFPSKVHPDSLHGPDRDLDDWLQLTNYYDAEHRESTLKWWREKRDLDKQQEELTAKFVKWEESRAALVASLAVAATPRPSVHPSIENKIAASSSQVMKPPPQTPKNAQSSAHVAPSSSAIDSKSEPNVAQKRPLSPGSQAGTGRQLKYSRRADDQAVSKQEDFIPLHNTASPSNKRHVDAAPLDRRITYGGRSMDQKWYNRAQDYMPYTRYDQDRYYAPHRPEYRTPHGGKNRRSATRYFLVKSWCYENVFESQMSNIWATQEKNSVTFEKAFNESESVILFFSVNKSMAIQGYAEMCEFPGTAPAPKWAKKLNWPTSAPFYIRWRSKAEIFSGMTDNIRNSFNENKSVKVGFDGQEIAPEAGAELRRIMDDEESLRLSVA